MEVLISGASGLVGGGLAKMLRAEGHSVRRLVRTAPVSASDIAWDPAGGTADVLAMEGADAVVNLSGASIGAGRWTSERKRILRGSRIDATRVLVESLARLRQKPQIFVSASAVGYYGNRGEEVLTEASEPGEDFLAHLARDWELEAVRAESFGVPTTVLRFGVILSTEGGALPRIMTPFEWGIGGRLGNGRQWMSWVALEDAVAIIWFAIASGRLAGAVNVVAPNPVRNSEFTQTLASVLRRPAVVPAPAFALRWALGEMADPLLLASERVRPDRLCTAGYKFGFDQLGEALQAMIAKKIVKKRE